MLVMLVNLQMESSSWIKVRDRYMLMFGDEDRVSNECMAMILGPIFILRI